jgi:hypothetical protein
MLRRRVVRINQYKKSTMVDIREARQKTHFT